MGGMLPPVAKNDRLPGRGARGQAPLSSNIPTPGEIRHEIERLVLNPRRDNAQRLGACIVDAYRRGLAVSRRNPVFVTRPVELRDGDLKYFVAEMARHGWKVTYHAFSSTDLCVEPLDERLR